MPEQINLGDEVRHKYTGFVGTATAATEYLSGCRRIAITPKVGKDGKLGDTCSFDEPEIEVTKKMRVERVTSTGGFKPEAKHYLK
jgi:hypothetical protein